MGMLALSQVSIQVMRRGNGEEGRLVGGNRPVILPRDVAGVRWRDGEAGRRGTRADGELHPGAPLCREERKLHGC